MKFHSNSESESKSIAGISSSSSSADTAGRVYLGAGLEDSSWPFFSGGCEDRGFGASMTDEWNGVNCSFEGTSMEVKMGSGGAIAFSFPLDNGGGTGAGCIIDDMDLGGAGVDRGAVDFGSWGDGNMVKPSVSSIRRCGISS